MPRDQGRGADCLSEVCQLSAIFIASLTGSEQITDNWTGFCAVAAESEQITDNRTGFSAIAAECERVTDSRTGSFLLLLQR